MKEDNPQGHQKSLHPVSFENIKADTIIIGFTGALGSGCTYFAKSLKQFHGYHYLSLSKHIKAELPENSSPEELQDKGNEIRLSEGNDVLVWKALIDAEHSIEDDSGKVKLVIDGIRNAGEVATLRQFPNFFLFSVQAEEEERKKRLLESNKCNDHDHFKHLDERDADERIEHGQQVKKCNYLSDIIINNDEVATDKDHSTYRTYTEHKLFNRFVTFIEGAAQGRRDFSHFPSEEETLMTMAYAESKKSKCIKRKVGAVITTADELVLSIGYNNPPDDVSCLDHPDYKWCARDVLMEKYGASLYHCPVCGAKISIEETCRHCGEKLTKYSRRCPHCDHDPSIEYLCPECNTNIFKEYLPGGKAETGKMLDLCRSLHAEENAILNLCRAGISANQAKKIYTTAFPCNLCANKILKLGIKEVVYSEPYVTKEAEKVLSSINTKRFEGVKSSAFFRIFS
ncbi:MAG: hypothetical protein R6V10_16935 [bacterium]